MAVASDGRRRLHVCTNFYLSGSQPQRQVAEKTELEAPVLAILSTFPEKLRSNLQTGRRFL